MPYKDKNHKKLRDAAAYAADPESAKNRVKKWRKENPEKWKEQCGRIVRDPVKEKKRHSAYRAANAEKILSSGERYRTNNPDKIANQSRLRKQYFLQACPKWSNAGKIKEIYSDAREFREMGLDVHVDHIVPLRAKLACGLHNEFNLTIKLASWNDSKGNKFDV